MVIALRIVVALLATVTWCQVGLAEAKATVLFIGKQPDHPFGTHMYLHTGHMLQKCLQNNGVATVVSDGWPKDKTKLDGVRTIVIYTTPAAELLLDGPHRDEVDALMKQGVGMVTLHWASSVFDKNLDRLGPTWLSYMGGTWVSNVGLHTGKSHLKQLQPQHPVCRGWDEYEIHDEYYLNPTIKTATPLLQVMAKEKPVVVAWAYERPNGGRAVATTLGHFYRNFQREPFRKMVANAILWTAKVPVPTNGADVALDEKDLALPPAPKKP